jgi:hypothetical protein
MPDTAPGTLAVTITEPATLITDYVLAIVAVVLAVLVARRRRPVTLSTRLWIASYFATAAAAAAGGTFHGFALYFTEPAHSLLWDVTVALIGASSLIVLSAALSGPRGWQDRNTPWLISGALLTAVGVAVQQSGYVFHPRFNHNDVFHSTQTVALYLFYRGTHSIK